MRSVSDMINVAYVRQKEALGLGHAVLRAKELVGPEPFAAILSDDVIDSEVPAIRQLLDVYEFYGASVVALMEVEGDAISAYGAVDAEPVSHNGSKDRLFRIRNMVEKPKPSEAPSNLAIIGRYVLTPEIFQSIESIEPGQRRRTPTHRRAEAPAAQPSDLWLPLRRQALRRGRQTRIPESDGGVRAAALRSWRRVPRVSAAS